MSTSWKRGWPRGADAGRRRAPHYYGPTIASPAHAEVKRGHYFSNEATTSYVVVRQDDGKERLYHQVYLRADEGSLEINRAIEALTEEAS